MSTVTTSVQPTTFSVSFLEQEGEYVIINNATGKTAFIPDLVRIWNHPGEVSPPMTFSRLRDGTITYAAGDFHSRKEIGLYNVAEGWVCIVTDNPGFLNLEHYKKLKWRRDIKDNIVSFNAGYFNFYDLESGVQIRFTAKLLEEPKTGRWHLSLPQGNIPAYQYNAEQIRRNIERLTRDHAEYGAESEKFGKTSVSIPTGTGFTQMFRPAPNREGMLFEFWKMSRESWSDKYERYFEGEYRNIAEKIFFHRRADHDAPVYSGQGIDFYRPFGGVQIEDTVNHEKYYYVAQMDYLIRTSWEADTLPIEVVHNQIQIFDCSHPGYMPRIESNCSGSGDDRGITRQIIAALAPCIRHEDWEAVASIIRNRDALFHPEPEERKPLNPYDDFWKAFPSAKSNWYYTQRNREIKLVREGGNTPAAEVLKSLLDLKRKDQYDNVYSVVS